MSAPAPFFGKIMFGSYLPAPPATARAANMAAIDLLRNAKDILPNRSLTMTIPTLTSVRIFNRVFYVHADVVVQCTFI